jgi:uncharacterized protein (TIGR01741 family)
MDTPFETQSEKLYQQIGKTIVEMIPEEWEKVYLYAEVSEGFSYVYFYYYPVNHSSPVYFLDIPEKFHISDTEFDEIKHQLFEEFVKLWDTFREHNQEPWTNLTLFLDSSGKLKIHFDYEDLSHASPRKRRIFWRYQYLGIVPENQRDRSFIDEYLKQKKEDI